MLAVILAKVRRRFATDTASAVLIEIALTLLPFWPNGLLPQDVTAYLVNVAVATVGVGRQRLS